MDSNLKLKLQSQEKALIYIRDALSFYLTGVRVRNNVYNLIIIVVSMMTAFFETLKTEFEWGTAKKSWLRSFATIAPIGMSTFIALVSTMMKFERITEKMEETTKSVEKCHYAINKQRETRDKSPVATEAQVEEAILSFREAIMNAEMLWLSRMDPKTKRKFLTQSDNIHDMFGDLNIDMEVIRILEQSFKPDTPVGFGNWRFFSPERQKTSSKDEESKETQITLATDISSKSNKKSKSNGGGAQANGGGTQANGGGTQAKGGGTQVPEEV